ncbi:DUF1617 family protein [Pseudolactococcus reticulitermitis]|uniref:DUF1617 family protein n=1 Tax=Pseudolactococcus reticulitermitis TaxID=2025039 RepID=A0A224X5E2_9LACT|nr:DUF1617 family protein [Lactococcus reticulitermitis]GAX46760.1 hypothetical protein RsY01_339 [Lactococcus reticulitermitis]
MLTIKNKELASVINFLSDLELAPKSSRIRSKLVTKFMSKHDEYAEDEQSIFDVYGERDDNGELIKVDETSYKIAPDKLQECLAEHNKLVDEEVKINLDELKDNVKYLVGKLEKLDIKLSGQDASTYDLIMDKLEGEI